LRTRTLASYHLNETDNRVVSMLIQSSLEFNELRVINITGSSVSSDELDKIMKLPKLERIIARKIRVTGKHIKFPRPNSFRELDFEDSSVYFMELNISAVPLLERFAGIDGYLTDWFELPIVTHASVRALNGFSRCVVWFWFWLNLQAISLRSA
jgi:hypothetical protein